jgi:hypothetical protein
VRTLRTVPAVVALGFLALVGLPALTPQAAQAAQAAQRDSTSDRTLRDGRITESSGLTVSRRTPGVLWTHNDSGTPPLLYAVGPGGDTLGTARVTGVPNIDWEALVPVTGRDGSRLLAIGDIGDNSTARSQIEIDLVPEPSVAGSSRIAPIRVLRLRYPDGPADAEALLADPRDGRLYVVTKGLLTSTIYAVPATAWPGTPGTTGRVRTVTATLEPVGRVNLTLVTDGAVLPNGRILLRTYTTLAVLPPLPTATATTGSSGPAGTASDVPTLYPLATTALPSQQQGEGMAVLDATAGVLLLSSEGKEASILRLTVPADVWGAGAAAASSASETSSASRTGRTPQPAAPSGGEGPGPVSGGSLSAAGTGAGDGRAGGSGGGSAWLITMAGAGVFAALLVIARVLGRQRHPW